MVKKFLNQLHFECIIKLKQLRVSLSIKQKFIVPWYYYYWKFHFLKKFLRRDMQMKLMNRLWFLEFLFQFSFFLSLRFHKRHWVFFSWFLCLNFQLELHTLFLYLVWVSIFMVSRYQFQNAAYEMKFYIFFC